LKIAILSDIHANWQALEAVLHDCPEVDETLCLGDVVGYGGDPKRCIDEVTDKGWLTLVGNHDRACTDPEILEWFNDDAATVVRWTVDVIGDEINADTHPQTPEIDSSFALVVSSPPRP